MRLAESLQLGLLGIGPRPPKTNMDTQNDAIFAAGDTFPKPSFFGIYVRFRGGRYGDPLFDSGQ